MHIIKCSFETDASFSRTWIALYTIQVKRLSMFYMFTTSDKKGFTCLEKNTSTILCWRRPFLLLYLTNWGEVYEHSYKLTDNMFRIPFCNLTNMFMMRWGDGYVIKLLCFIIIMHYLYRVLHKIYKHQTCIK